MLRSAHRIATAVLLVVFATEAEAQPTGTRLDTDTAGFHSSSNPHLAHDGSGNVHAVWQDFRGSEWAIYYRRGTTFGAAWPTAEIKLSSPGNAVSPRVSAKGSFVVVTWRSLSTMASGSTFSEKVFAASSTTNGLSWSLPIQVNSGSGMTTDYVSDPDIAAIDATRALIGWTQATGTKDHAYVSSTSNAGASWATGVQLTTSTTARARNLRVAAGEVTAVPARQYAYAAYVDETTSGTFEVHCKGSLNGGISFPVGRAAVVNVPSASLPLELDLAANLAGDIHVVWTDALAGLPGQDWVIQGQRNLNHATNTSWLGAPIRVDAPPSPIDAAYEPSVVVDSGGNGYAAYTEVVGNVPNVFVNKCSVLGTTWGVESQLTFETTAHSALHLMRPYVASVSLSGQPDAIAAVWAFEPEPNAEYADVWLSYTRNSGSTWTVAQQVGSAPGSTTPGAASPHVVMRWTTGTAPLAGIAWDERWNWTLPGGGLFGGGGATGYGAPESYFVSVMLP